MSPTFHEKLDPVPGTRFMLAAWSLDMMARLSILEGAANRPPGSWLRLRERGFGEALEHFGPTLNALWSTTRDTGVYNVAVETATRALKSHVPGQSGEDLVQELIAGSSSGGGPRRKRLFYSVGETLRKDLPALKKGRVTPNSSEVRGTIHNWVERAARDVLKANRQRATRSLPHERVAPHPGLDPDQRAKLFLLAFQSTGQVGRKVREIIDREIDHAFGNKTAPLVRLFLEKIAHPKYRSLDEMKRMIGKRWDVNQWFTQAYNKVRKEIMAETGASSATLTNVLGSKASKVFRFMRERVGRNHEIQKILEQLADQVELLEPGQVRMGANKESADKEEALTQRQTPTQSWHGMQDWLHSLMTPHVTSMDVPMDVETGELPEREGAHDPLDWPLDEKDAAPLLPEQTPVQPWSNVRDWLEKDEHMDWDTQVGPHSVYNRGPVTLRVASEWMKHVADEQWKQIKEENDFHEWVQNKKFRHQETDNMDQYVSLPPAQRKQIRDWWRANKCTGCSGKGVQQGFLSQEQCPTCRGTGVGAGSGLGTRGHQMMDVLKELMSDPDAGKGLPGDGGTLWQEILKKEKGGNPLHVMRAIRKFMYELPHDEKHGASGRYTKLYKSMKEAFKEYQENLDSLKGDEAKGDEIQKGQRYIVDDKSSGSSTSRRRDITVTGLEDFDGPEGLIHYEDGTGQSGTIDRRQVGKKVNIYHPKTSKQASLLAVAHRWLYGGVR